MILQSALIIVGLMSFLHLIWVANAIQYEKTRWSILIEVVVGAGFSVGMAIAALQGNLADAMTFALVVLGSYVAHHFDLDMYYSREHHVERRWRATVSSWLPSRYDS